MDAGPFTPNEAVALSIDPGAGAAAIGEHGGAIRWAPDEVVAGIARIERAIGPRWVWWTSDTAQQLVDAGIRPARCWDLDAVHRLLHGGWRAGPAVTWAATHELDPDRVPSIAPVDLFSAAAGDDDRDPDDPVRADGHLDPGWVGGAWSEYPDRLGTWATLALEVYRRQLERIDGLDERPAAPATASPWPTCFTRRSIPDA